MSEQNESLVRTAYAAFSQGDVATMLKLVHPDLEWTFLDPALANPEAQTCFGREQLQQVMERRGGMSPQAEVEEIASSGDKVMVIVHTPGLDQQRARQAEDRNYMVVTVQQGQITALRACRDRDEARRLTGLSSPGAGTAGEVPMQLTVLSVPGCPNVALLEERLAPLLAGWPGVTVTRRVIATEKEAARSGMHGSPTILVDGVDPFAGPGAAASLSCRLYPSSEGRADGAPSVSQLRQAIGGPPASPA